VGQARAFVTVSFAVLSYAGSLTITLIADPDTCPDLSDLRDALEEEVRVLTESTHH
jgi:diacylglycerol O-acyltransferase / wax synthase